MLFFQIPCVFTVGLNFQYANFSDLQLFYVQNWLCRNFLFLRKIPFSLQSGNLHVQIQNFLCLFIFFRKISEFPAFSMTGIFFCANFFNSHKKAQSTISQQGISKLWEPILPVFPVQRQKLHYDCPITYPFPVGVRVGVVGRVFTLCGVAATTYFMAQVFSAVIPKVNRQGGHL